MDDICPLLSIALGELTYCREQKCHWYSLELTCCKMLSKEIIGITEFKHMTNMMITE